MSKHIHDLENYIFTSESVSEGHPDKICDRVSDAVLDCCLKADPNARVACEALVTNDKLVLAGELRVPDSVTKDVIEEVARKVIEEIGYDQKGFSHKTVDIDVLLHRQSPDIAQGVDTDGAGDQGIMFGYACRETEVLMPAPIYYSHAILKSLASARHSGRAPKILPDAKSQVTLEYVNDKPVRARSVVVSTQHVEGCTQEEVREIVRPHVESVLPEGWMCEDSEFYVNPTGRFVIGGPVGDAGLTGRKIIVDTYGGAAPHGGGAFSGKDATKVDRSAAYAARYLAKNVVAAGLAEGCTVQLSYAIGVAHPISVYLNTHGTSEIHEDKIVDALTQLVDLTPKGIIDHLNLRKPIFEKTSAYGHFGRSPQEDGSFSWERTDLVEPLRKILG